MERIFLDYLKKVLIWTSVRDPRIIAHILNERLVGVCEFKCTLDWELQLFKDGNLVKKYKLITSPVEECENTFKIIGIKE